jgi:hypothetical protein
MFLNNQLLNYIVSLRLVSAMSDSCGRSQHIDCHELRRFQQNLYTFRSIEKVKNFPFFCRKKPINRAP